MAAGVHAEHFMFIHVIQDLLTEKVGGAVGRRTGQDAAGAFSLLYLLDGLHQSHSLPCTENHQIDSGSEGNW